MNDFVNAALNALIGSNPYPSEEVGRNLRKGCCILATEVSADGEIVRRVIPHEEFFANNKEAPATTEDDRSS